MRIEVRERYHNFQNKNNSDLYYLRELEEGDFVASAHEKTGEQETSKKATGDVLEWNRSYVIETVARMLVMVSF